MVASTPADVDPEYYSVFAIEADGQNSGSVAAVRRGIEPAEPAGPSCVAQLRWRTYARQEGGRVHQILGEGAVVQLRSDASTPCRTCSSSRVCCAAVLGSEPVSR